MGGEEGLGAFDPHFAPLAPCPPTHPPAAASACWRRSPRWLTALLERGVRQVVYLAHGGLAVAQAVAQHIKMCQRCAPGARVVGVGRAGTVCTAWPGCRRRCLPCSACCSTTHRPPFQHACSGGSRAGHTFDFSLVLMPRRTAVAEKILEERGILGDVAIR